LDRAAGSYEEHVEQRASLDVTLTIPETATYDTFMDDLRIGAKKFVRLDVLGPEISPGANYVFQWDVACQISDAPSVDDADGVQVIEIPLAAERDGTWGKTTAAKLIRKT
jgi:hypothetical protein